MSAKLAYTQRVAADWEAAGAPAPNEASQKNFRERFAALDGPDAEKVAYDLGNGIPSPLAYAIGWTEQELIAQANARRTASMNERRRLQGLKRERLATEMKELREAMGLSLPEMDSVLVGRSIYNIVVKPGFSKNIEMKGGHYSMEVLEGAHEAYSGIALLRGVTVGAAAKAEAAS